MSWAVTEAISAPRLLVSEGGACEPELAAAAAAVMGAIVLISSLKEGKSPTVDAAAPTDAVQTETAAPAFTAAPALTFPTEGPLAAQLADKQLSDTCGR